MRAITGAVVSSKPCSLAKAARALDSFTKSAASDLPSSDCATYLRTAADAAILLFQFRRDLSRGDTAGFDGPVEGETKLHRRVGDGGGERDGSVAACLPGRSHDSARAEAELAVGAAGEKKSKKNKKIKKEDDHDDMAVAGVASLGPASPEIASEKRKKKEKHSSKDHVASHVKQEPDLVADGEMGSEKKKDKKKKKEKVHVKPEEQALDGMEVEEKIVNDGAAGLAIASGEKKRKKKKHREEEGNVKGFEEKEKLVLDGALGSEKKRKKKMGRGDDDDNGLEQVDHTKKKQRKQS